jgi:hypothetical protein
MAMDVEKTIEFILEQTAQIVAMQMKAEERFARHDAEIARHDAEIARHAAEIAREDLRLRRAIRLAVREARNERKRRQEMDARFDLKMDQIASAHLLTEDIVKRVGERIDKLGDKIDKLIATEGNGRGHL